MGAGFEPAPSADDKEIVVKKLAIVGTHPATRENAPFNDPDYEIWVFNEAPQAEWCKRWDEVFQLHKPEVYKSPNNMTNKEHWAWLQKSHGKTIWMQDVDPLVPDSKKYPLDEILEKSPAAKMRWFDLSFAYAMALAMLRGYEYIEVYGADLISNTEYIYQLRCWNYWVGAALGAGIDVVLKCSPNDFGNGRLYAYEGEIQIDRSYFKLRIEELTKQFEGMDRELEKVKNKITDALVNFNHKDIPALVIDYQQKAVSAGEYSGALSQAEEFLKRDDLISRQEYERHSARGHREAEEQRNLVYMVAGKIDYVWQAWSATKSYEAREQLQFFIREFGRLAFDMGAMSGCYMENKLYLRENDARITAAGGTKTVEALTGQA